MGQRGFGSFLSAVAGLLLCIAQAGCGGGGTPPEPPKILQQPQATTAADGSAVSFTVAAAGAMPLSYQWMRAGLAIPGATAPTLTLPQVTLIDNQTLFSALVSNSAGSVMSDSARLTVTPLAPSLAAQSQTAVVAHGGQLVLDSHARGTQPMTYQWSRRGIAINGATASTLALEQVSIADDGADYAVQVSNALGSVKGQVAVLNVSLPGAVKPVTACQEITQGGKYQLQGDIGAADIENCLSIHDTSAVQIECGNFSMNSFGGIDIRNVQHLSIRNCRLKVVLMVLDRVTRANISNSSFEPAGLPYVHTTATMASVLSLHSSDLEFDGNVVLGNYAQSYCNNCTVSNNRFTVDPGVVNGGPLGSSYGLHNRYIANDIDGQWDGRRVAGLSENGSQNGMALADETDALVARNNIRNVYGSGILFMGGVDASILRDNMISNAGFSVFGGWFYVSVSGSKFLNNVIDRSGLMFRVFRAYGLRASGYDYFQERPADVAVLFKDNLVEGNVVTNSISPYPDQAIPASYIPVFDLMHYQGELSGDPGERVPSATDFQLTNNVFRNNDFGRVMDAPSFGDGPVVPGLIIDGGGNKCKPSPAAQYPLVCL